MGMGEMMNTKWGTCTQFSRGQDFNVDTIVLLTETRKPKSPLPLCVVLLLRRTLPVEILTFPVHTGIIAHIKYEY